MAWTQIGQDPVTARKLLGTARWMITARKAIGPLITAAGIRLLMKKYPRSAPIPRRRIFCGCAAKRRSSGTKMTTRIVSQTESRKTVKSIAWN